MTLDEIINKVADDNDLPRKYVGKIYRAYWRTVNEYISSLPLKSITEEEFSSIRPNVNIPALGTLYVTLENYKKEKEEWNKKMSNEKYAAYTKNNAKTR